MPHNKNVSLGIVAHKKILGCTEVVSVCQYHCEEPTTHLYPSSITPSSRCRGVHPLSFQGPYRGHSVVPGIAEQRHRNKDIATWPFGRHHTCVTLPSHASPRHTCSHWQRKPNVRPQLQNTIFAHHHICLEAFRCSAQTVCKMRGSVANGARSGSTRYTIHSLAFKLTEV